MSLLKKRFLGNAQSQKGSLSSIGRRRVYRAALVPAIIGLMTATANAQPTATANFFKVVKYTAASDTWQQFIAACESNMTASAADPGVVQFVLLQASADTHEVIVIESYESKNSSDQHQKTSHFKKFIATLTALKIQRSVMAGTPYRP